MQTPGIPTSTTEGSHYYHFKVIETALKTDSRQKKWKTSSNESIITSFCHKVYKTSSAANHHSVIICLHMGTSVIVSLIQTTSGSKLIQIGFYSPQCFIYSIVIHIYILNMFRELLFFIRCFQSSEITLNISCQV